MVRDRKVDLSSSPPDPYGEPGSLVRAYARRRNWPLLKRNVMLEGRSDVEYFRIADLKHQEQVGRRLICDNLSLFQVGDGEAGGADNIKDKFQFLREVLSTENFTAPSDRIMAVVLLDNDYKGRLTTHFLEKQGFKPNRDVLLLSRRIPRETRDVYQMTRLLKDANASWADMDCEIEDLLSLDLLEYFCEMEPTCMAREPVIRENGHHFEWTRDGKAKLLRFVKEEASHCHLLGIVELLKSLRYLLCLGIDGV